jgi:dTDP-4-dehydrorhamnose 3,5-epimerase-like enzyme
MVFRMIEGVKTKNLRVIPDERGWLMEILRCDEDLYESLVKSTLVQHTLKLLKHGISTENKKTTSHA